MPLGTLIEILPVKAPVNTKTALAAFVALRVILELPATDWEYVPPVAVATNAVVATLVELLPAVGVLAVKLVKAPVLAVVAPIAAALMPVDVTVTRRTGAVVELVRAGICAKPKLPELLVKAHQFEPV